MLPGGPRSLFAGIVALALGVEANLRAERAARATAAGVAALVSLPLYQLRATLEVLQENSETVRASKEGHAAWLHGISKWFAESRPLIQDKHLPLLTSLPPLELQCLALADDALARFKAKHLLPPTTTVAEVVAAFDTFMDKALALMPIVVETSNQIHRLSPNDGFLPPWDAVALRRAAAKPPDNHQQETTQ